VAGNGLEVLSALDRQAYDVILMDMQMPEMDGLEATRLIRGRSDGFNQPRIIAMTANVTKDDRQACLDAGMDDYLAKPIRIEELIAVLNKSKQFSTHGSDSTQDSLSPDQPIKTPNHQEIASPILDPIALDQLLKLVGGDKDNFFKLIDSFLEETPKLLEGVRKAVENKNLEYLRRMSHTLKSSCRDFGAIRLSNLGAQLEAISNTGNIGGALELFEQAKMEYASVDNSLKNIRVGADHV